MTPASKTAVQGPETGGTLFVTGTPIGNLQDICERARNVLSAVDLVAAEDTRRTRTLLSHLGISVRLISCREQNEEAGTEKILEILSAGHDVALVTDAGMPALSDPGRRAVHIVRDHGYRIVPVPGPSAVTTALSVSGMPADRFHFEGFLPSKQAARRRRLEELAPLECTLVFFEAPHRLKATLADMERHLGDRETFMARELTKLHETLVSTKLSVLREMVSKGVKGEITLVVAGATVRPPDLNGTMKDSLREILTCLLFSDRLSTRNASALLASVTGISRNTLYSMALELKKENHNGKIALKASDT